MIGGYVICNQTKSVTVGGIKNTEEFLRIYFLLSQHLITCFFVLLILKEDPRVIYAPRFHKCLVLIY